MPVNIGPRVSWIIAALIVLLTGCASSEFSEADRGQTKIVDAGSQFAIALTSVHPWEHPSLKGQCVAFLNQVRDESIGTTVFRFKANLEGESEIVIRALPAWGEDRDFSMWVRVVESSWGDDGESVFDDDWRERWGRSGLDRDR